MKDQSNPTGDFSVLLKVHKDNLGDVLLGLNGLPIAEMSVNPIMETLQIEDKRPKKVAKLKKLKGSYHHSRKLDKDGLSGMDHAILRTLGASTTKTLSRKDVLAGVNAEGFYGSSLNKRLEHLITKKRVSEVAPHMFSLKE